MEDVVSNKRDMTFIEFLSQLEIQDKEEGRIKSALVKKRIVEHVGKYGDISMKDIEEPYVLGLYNFMTEGISHSLAFDRYIRLRAVFETAVKMGLIKENYLRRIDPPEL